jgi:hypothetical protein
VPKPSISHICKKEMNKQKSGTKGEKTGIYGMKSGTKYSKTGDERQGIRRQCLYRGQKFKNININSKIRMYWFLGRLEIKG